MFSRAIKRHLWRENVSRLFINRLNSTKKPRWKRTQMKCEKFHKTFAEQKKIRYNIEVEKTERFIRSEYCTSKTVVNLIKNRTRLKR